MTELSVFFDNGSTCSLILTETAELLGCPGEPVKITIDTINGLLTRETKLYCVELISNGGERVIIRAFGVECISNVQNIVDLSVVKNVFSDEVQSQWGKIKANLIAGENNTETPLQEKLGDMTTLIGYLGVRHYFPNQSNLHSRPTVSAL